MGVNLLNTLWVWMVLMNVFVMSPVIVDSERNMVKIRTGWKYFTYCVAFATIYFYLFFDSFLTYISKIGFDKVHEVLYTLTSCWIVCSFVVRIFTGYNGNKYKFVRVLKTILWIDDRLGGIDRVKLDWMVRIEFFCLLLLCLYRFFIAIVFFGKLNLQCFWCPQVFYVAELLFFHNNVWMTKECLRLTEERLRSMKNRGDFLVIKGYYEKTIECAEIINDIFGWRNLNYSINMFVETSVLVFLLLKKMLEYDVRVNMSVWYRFCLALWPLFLIVFFTKIVAICSETNSKSKRIGRVISDVARTCRRDRDKKQVWDNRYLNEILIDIFSVTRDVASNFAPTGSV